jgi:pimeloyl-ACP methyl ester carboxylesterase
MESPFRLRKELRTAMPSRSVRWRFAGQQLHALLRAPLSPSRMAARAVFIADTDIVADCARVAAPTLIVTGEPTLDRVVSVEGTLAYLNLIPRAQHVTLPATGHLGSITRPEVFLAAVDEFVSGLRDQLADGSSPGEQNDAA